MGPSRGTLKDPLWGPYSPECLVAGVFLENFVLTQFSKMFVLVSGAVVVEGRSRCVLKSSR